MIRCSKCGPPPSREEIRNVIEGVYGTFVEDYEYVHPENVNWGMCHEFANDVAFQLLDGRHARAHIHRVPSSRISDSEYPLGFPCHYWIELGGRYYDSEAPHGVTKPSKLPIFQRYLNSRTRTPANRAKILDLIDRRFE